MAGDIFTLDADNNAAVRTVPVNAAASETNSPVIFTTDEDGNTAVRTVSVNAGASETNSPVIFTTDENGNAAVRVVGAGGGSTPVIDELNVTPSTSAQTITAPSGTDGYSPVNVAAVTSAIDANIVAENIKKDVEILGVTGSYKGATPTGTKSITANGVYDVADFASADVQVPTTVPAHYVEYPVNSAGELIQPTSFDTLNAPKIIGENGLKNALYYNGSITTVNLSNIEVVKRGGLAGFGYASVLVSADLSSLVVVEAAALSEFCRANSHFTSINLASLKVVSDSAFPNSFRSTAITVLNFPALKTLSPTAFYNLLLGTSNIVVYAPSNMQTTVEGLSAYPNFGGTNASWLFDLPATNILTGANSVNYERNPKYDTATALAWRVQDTGTAPNLVIDWTPYYTSGISDPDVSDTIYSDSACTISVTTISSIA